MKKFAIIYLMATLYKRKTLTKTITLMAMMAAINVIFSLLGAYIPVLSVILIIFLPLTSAFIEVSCEDKYFPIYAFGTFGLCLAATFHIIDFAILYIIPSIITGYLFGLMSKKKVSSIWAIFIATIAQTIITYALIPLLELITEINFIDYTITLLHLDEINNIRDFVLLGIFLASLAQIILSYIVCSSELKKLGFENKKISELDCIVHYSTIGATVLSIPFFFIFKGLGYLFTSISIFFAIFVIYESIAKREYRKLILYAIIIFINIFAFGIFNPMISTGQFLLIGFSPLLIGIISLFKIK